MRRRRTPPVRAQRSCGPEMLASLHEPEQPPVQNIVIDQESDVVPARPRWRLRRRSRDAPATSSGAEADGQDDDDESDVADMPPSAGDGDK